jgi:hypothetical protein
MKLARGATWLITKRPYLRQRRTSNEWDAFIAGVKDGEFDDLLEDLPEEPDV